MKRVGYYDFMTLVLGLEPPNSPKHLKTQPCKLETQPNPHGVILGLYWGNLGTMENRMETIISYRAFTGVVSSHPAPCALNPKPLIPKPLLPNAPCALGYVEFFSWADSDAHAIHAVLTLRMLRIMWFVRILRLAAIGVVLKGPRTQIIESLYGGYKGVYRDIRGLYEGPRTQIMGFKGPNTITLMVCGP